MQKLKLESNVLHGYFDPSFKPNIPVPVETEQFDNDDPKMLGYGIIKEIQSINIDEISFGKLLISTSETVSSLVEFSKTNKSVTNDHSSKGMTLGPIESKCVVHIESLYALGVLQTQSLVIEKNVEKIKALKSEITDKVRELRLAIPKILKIIDDNEGSPDTQTQMRVQLLQKFYAFQVLRLKTIEQHLDASEKTLANASNFLSFTLTNLTYNLQPNILNMSTEEALDIFSSSIIKKMEAHENRWKWVRNKLHLLYGPAIASIIYALICYITPDKNLIFAMGVLFWCIFLCICAVLIIWFAITAISWEENGYTSSRSSRSSKKNKDKEGCWAFSLGLITFMGILCVDIFILGMKLIHVPSLFFFEGLMVIAGIIIYKMMYPADKIQSNEDFATLRFQYNQIREQFVQYKINVKLEDNPVGYFHNKLRRMPRFGRDYLMEDD